MVYQSHDRISYHQELIADKNVSFQICKTEDDCMEQPFHIVYTKEHLPTFGYLSYQNSLVGFLSSSRYQKFIEQSILIDMIMKDIIRYN